MKNITTNEQRKLYKAYKESRMEQLGHLNSLFNTGNYSRPSYSDMLAKAKQDIMDFVSVFEETIIQEAIDELYENEDVDDRETDICKCEKPYRYFKLVEGKSGWVKDIYCKECEKPIYP
ncbi:hypothetical protein ABWK22_01910 [Gottfriedia acidiceleris]|uniref:hypothetical protein n=1 Tax=Gottfriedia acidiceleris TaxID=371036 RepID=UPI003393F9C7